MPQQPASSTSTSRPTSPSTRVSASRFITACWWQWVCTSARRRALVQTHCHQHAVMKRDAETRVLGEVGLDVEVLDAGCCGMAGAFGFERGERYQVSLRCAERALLPAVRAAAAETLIVADGFSCREQIAQGSERQALHLAQVLQMAMRESMRKAMR